MSTSLYNPMTVLGKTAKALEHPYKGKVIQVDKDPNYIGRIKVSIPELYGDYVEGSEGTLPWIYPRYLGKFRGLLELDFPEKGDTVEVIFPYKNIYLGYYTNKPLYKDVWDRMAQVDPDLGAALKQIFCGEHYSNVYGSFDRNLTGWYIDKVLDEIFFIQGTTKGSIKIDTEGSWHIYVPKSMYIEVVEDVEIKVGRNVEIDVGTKIHTHVPDMQVNIDNTLTFTSTTNNITSPTTNITGAVNVTLDVVGSFGARNISLIGHIHNNPAIPTTMPLPIG